MFSTVTAFFQVLLASLVLGFVSQALAEENLSADLAEVYTWAVENDPQWASTQFAYQADKLAERQGLSPLLPQINFGASKTRVKLEQEPTDTRPSTDESSTRNEYGLTLSQALFSMDTWYDYKKAKITDKLVDAQFEKSRQDFIIRVVENYFDILSKKEALAFAKAEEQAISRQLDQTRQRFDVGLIPITDVHEAQAAYDINKVALIQAETNLSISYENLEAITGRTMTDIADLKDKLPITPPQPNNVDEWLGLANEKNPDLILAELSQRSAASDVKISKSGHAPTLDLNAAIAKSSEYEAAFGTAPESTQTTIALELNVPLYSGGATQTAVKQSQLRYDQARDDLRFARRQAKQNTNNLFRLVNTHVLNVKARRQAIKSSESALEATQAGYEVGTRNVVDVLQAQRALFATKRDYADARYNYLLDSLRLKAITGMLSENEITELNNWLE